VKAGWEKSTLGEVLETLRNGLNCKQDKSGKGSKISRIESIASAKFNPERVGYATLDSKEKARFRLHAGDILFSHINSPAHVGKTAIFDCDEEIYHGVNLLLMRPKPFLYPRFLNYWLLSVFEGGYWRKACKQSVNQASVNQQDIGRLVVHFPNQLAEQRRIVSILDEAFAGLEAMRANAEKNLQNARELFDSYLSDVFSNDAGWTEKSFDEICAIDSKLVDPRKPSYIDLPHLGAGNMVSRTGALIEIKTAREEGLISGKFFFDRRMVLYSKIRPYLMKACRPEFEGLCSADVYPLLPNAGVTDRNFLFHLLMTPRFTEYAIHGSARAGMPKVNREHLFAYRCKMPDLKTQEALAYRLDSAQANCSQLEAIYEQKLAAIVELKQAILQKAFAGELTAAEAVAA
jgi:type I restriction enzyme S subunit